MSNTLAIASVTSMLRFVLERSLAGPAPGAVGGATVTTLRPADVPSGGEGGGTEIFKGINVFLYRVSPNHAGNVSDLPTRRSDGSLARRPAAVLDLHYLLTFHGDDTELDAQRLLGRAVLALAVTPVLTRELVATALQHYAGQPPTAFLADADLADQVELVKLAPAAVSEEELARLWGTFGTAYRLCLTYVATAVVLETAVPVRTALPVLRRALTVGPVARVRLEAVEPVGGGAVVVGTKLTLRGSGLRPTGAGQGTVVRIGPVELPPTIDPDRLLVTVTPAVPAGVHSVSVVHRAPPGPGGAPARLAGRSNALPVLVRPVVTVGPVTATAVTLTVTPPLYPRQHSVVTLSRLDAAPPTATTVVAFTLPPPEPATPPVGSVELARAEVPVGRWLVRITVDGAESLPTTVGETYAAPALVLT
jgi:hypothetical protein